MYEFAPHHKYDEFECPQCGHRISKMITEDQPGNVRTYIWRCRGCGREFGPEWTVGPNGQTEPPTVLIGLNPWRQRTDTFGPLLLRPLTASISIRAIVVRAAPAIVLAAGSIFLVLNALLDKHHRSMVLI